MRVLLLNGSFRGKKLSGESNNSKVFLNYLQAMLTGDVERKKLI